MSNLFVKRFSELKPEESGKHYKLEIYCTNCGRHQSVYLLKGIRKDGKEAHCEYCGCGIKL